LVWLIYEIKAGLFWRQGRERISGRVVGFFGFICTRIPTVFLRTRFTAARRVIQSINGLSGSRRKMLEAISASFCQCGVYPHNFVVGVYVVLYM